MLLNDSTMSAGLTSWKTLDPSNIAFDGPEVEVEDTGRLAVPLLYHGKKVIVQTPKLNVETDLVKNNTRQKFVDLLIPDSASAFADFIEAMEHRVMSAASSNRKAWFKHAGDVDVDEEYKSILRLIKTSSGTALRLRVKTSYERMSVFNCDREITPLEEVHAGRQAALILEFPSVFLNASGAWGLTVSALQWRVCDPPVEEPEKPEEVAYAFEDDEGSDAPKQEAGDEQAPANSETKEC